MEDTIEDDIQKRFADTNIRVYVEYETYHEYQIKVIAKKLTNKNRHTN